MGKQADRKTRIYGTTGAVSAGLAVALYVLMIVSGIKGGSVQTEWAAYAVPLLLCITLICQGRLWRDREGKAWDTVLREREEKEKK